MTEWGRAVKPALTPEEWARQIVERVWGDKERDHYEPRPVIYKPIPAERIALRLNTRSGTNTVGVSAEDLHAVAALALHQQPFGFTHEMVKSIRLAATAMDGRAQASDAARLMDAADRIAALLPPLGT